MPTFRIKEAASLLGVSTDTLYRWIEARRITAADDDHGLMAVDGVALATLAQDLAESADQTQRQDGRGPLGTKQIQRPGHPRGPRHRYGPGGDPGRAARIVSLLSGEATDELGLEPGMLVVAAVKATNVSVELPHSRSARS